MTISGTEEKSTLQTSVFPKALTHKELCELDLPAVKWAVVGLFESGTLNMISAKPNQFKTWFSLEIAVSLVTGKPVFGQFEVERQAVMVLNAEDSIRLMQERMVMVAPSLHDLPIYFHVNQEISLTEASVAALIAEMKKLHVRFLVLDPLCDLHDADENKAHEMLKVIKLLRRITREGITILLVHHWRKGTGQLAEGDALADEARGSSVIQGALNGHLSCRPAITESDGTKTIIVTQSKLKCAEKLKPFKIRFIVADGVATLAYAGESKTEIATNKADASVLAFLMGAAGRWTTIKEIIASEVAGEGAIRKALPRLESKGKVESKANQEISADGVIAPDAKHNAKFYRVIGENGGELEVPM